MPELYPALEPSVSGYLTAGEGHELYYEECGNPEGIPVLFLHGGPGSSCNPSHRRFFDPRAYRIVLFDQRGCGRSRPRGETQGNSVVHLIADMERLRLLLDVDRWMLFGGSWGSTLALAYTLSHPSRVLGMILRGVFLGSRVELQWYLEGLRHFVPEAWERFVEGIAQPATASIMDHYARALEGDQQSAVRAARRWSDYESAIMAIGEASGNGGAYDETALLARVRVQLHYLVHGCFLEAPLIDTAGALRTPTIIVQGRRDLVCPPGTAFNLHRVIQGSELHMVEAGGHSAMHPAMASALVQATDRYRSVESIPS